MVRLNDGTLRYFSIREMACLQGFPETYVFDPSWSRAVRETRAGNREPACPTHPHMARVWLEQLDRTLRGPASADEGGAGHPGELDAANPANEGVPPMGSGGGRADG